MAAAPFGLWPSLVQPFGLRTLPPAVLGAIVVWSLLWKGVALWKAARAGQLVWFVVLLFVNTVGLLEIIYIVFFAPRRASGDFAAATPAPPGGSGPAGPSGTPQSNARA